MKNDVKLASCIKLSILVLISLGSLGSASSFAEDARVLPKGRHRFSFNYGQSTGITETYNDRGQKVGITDPYKVTLDSATLASVDEDLRTLITTLNATGARYNAAESNTSTHGITQDVNYPLMGDALSRGFLDVGAEAKRTQYSFQLQRGFTDRLSAGFMIPIIKTQVRTRKDIAGLNSVRDAALAVDGWRNTPEAQKITQGLNEISSADINTLQGLLESRDYQRFDDYTGTGIGDITVGGRYNYYKSRSDEWINSFQTTLTAPTGRLKNTGSIVETDNGQGTWDFSLGHVFTFNPTINPVLFGGNFFTFSHSVNYKHRLPGDRALRVRESPTDFLPNAASEENVWMQLGDKFWTVFGTQFAFSKMVNLDTNYEFYWKGPDHYAGSRSKDYTYLSDATNLYLETASVAINVNTVDSFLKGGFPIPGNLSVTYYHPVRGKNTVVAPFWAAEMAMYF